MSHRRVLRYEVPVDDGWHTIGGHRVVYEKGAEAVCSCGAHLSIYGLTRSIASVFAEHVRNTRVLPPASGRA